MKAIAYSQENQVGLDAAKLQSSKEAQTRRIPILRRKSIKFALQLKYGNLTKASGQLKIEYCALSDTIAGRRHTINIIQAIQEDLNLTDEQVLEFWPLLGHWPKKAGG